MGGAFAKLSEVQTHTRFVSVYDLGPDLFDGVQGVLVPAHIDQRALQKHQPLLQRHLDNGGRLVLNGHMVHLCLAWLKPFVPLPERNQVGLQITRLADHPVFDGVDPRDLTYRRGVAGFYGRGHNPMPDGARPIHGIGPEQHPLDWELPLHSGGRVLMHSGNDLWMYAADATSARRIAPQLVNWLKEGVTA